MTFFQICFHLVYKLKCECVIKCACSSAYKMTCMKCVCVVADSRKAGSVLRALSPAG